MPKHPAALPPTNPPPSNNQPAATSNPTAQEQTTTSHQSIPILQGWCTHHITWLRGRRWPDDDLPLYQPGVDHHFHVMSSSECIRQQSDISSTAAACFGSAAPIDGTLPHPQHLILQHPSASTSDERRMLKDPGSSDPAPPSDVIPSASFSVRSEHPAQPHSSASRSAGGLPSPQFRRSGAADVASMHGWIIHILLVVAF